MKQKFKINEILDVILRVLGSLIIIASLIIGFSIFRLIMGVVSTNGLGAALQSLLFWPMFFTGAGPDINPAVVILTTLVFYILYYFFIKLGYSLLVMRFNLNKIQLFILIVALSILIFVK